MSLIEFKDFFSEVFIKKFIEKLKFLPKIFSLA